MTQRRLKLSIVADDDAALIKALGYAVGRIAADDVHGDYEFGDSATTFSVTDDHTDDEEVTT